MKTKSDLYVELPLHFKPALLKIMVEYLRRWSERIERDPRAPLFGSLALRIRDRRDNVRSERQNARYGA